MNFYFIACWSKSYFLLVPSQMWCPFNLQLQYPASTFHEHAHILGTASFVVCKLFLEVFFFFLGVFLWTTDAAELEFTPLL